MTLDLLLVKLRSARGSLRSTQEGRHRAPVFFGLSVLFWWMLYRASLRVVNEAMQLDPVGELLVQKLLSITFLVFLGLLIFSNIVTAFSTFYLADDLEFLMTKPVPRDSLFASRFIESLVQSSWVVILFGMPIFVAAGVGVGAPWHYYALLVGVLLPFVAIPTCIAALLALFVTNILAADRTRDAALFFGLVAFSVLFVVVRSLQPERLLNPDSFDSIGEMLRLLSMPTTYYLPSDWVMNTLVPVLFGGANLDWFSIGLLTTTPLALFFICAWLYRPFYPRGYSKAQEGRHGGSLMTVFRDWLFSKTTSVRGRMDAHLAKLNELGEKSISTLGQLVKKDQAIFTRDASQWSQLLIVFAIIVIYLVNFKYFEIAADESLLGDIGLYFFNLAACGFVVVALAGRFLFPAVSIEGRSFWLILQAPVSLEKFLIGKWLGAMLPIVIIGQFLIWASNLLVGQNLVYCLMASFTMLVATVGVAAMAVGFGAVYPQFHNPNAAKIASSFGAVIYMILGIFVVLLTLAGTFHVSMQFGAVYEGKMWRELTIWNYGTAIMGLFFPFIVAWLTIRMGAGSLRSRL
ncbi:MAG: putative ABC transporter permease subunit [Bradymonadaceae bacterium]